MLHTNPPLIVWHRDAEHGYRFASCCIGGAICRSYLRGDLPPQYPLPVVVSDATR
jgi:hypothetical protein